MKKNMRKIIAVILIITMLPWQDAITAYAAETEPISSQETADVDKQTEAEVIEDYIVSGEVTLQDNIKADRLDVRYNSILHLNGYEITVNEGATICGAVYVEQGSVNCLGNMDIKNKGCIIMEEINDNVYVNGNFSWSAESVIKNSLVRGILEVKGDFQADSRYGFITDGDLKIVLSGNDVQNISISSDAAVIGNLEILNSSTDGVYFDRFIRIDNIEDHGNLIHYTDENAYHGYKLTENTVVDGDYILYSGTLDLNGKKLTINGNLIQRAGCIDINNGVLVVNGDYRMQTPVYNKDNEVEYGIGYGVLKMNRIWSKVYVYGDFVCETNADHTGLMTGGYMNLYGNMTINNTGSEKAFVASGDHFLNLCGNKKQTVTFPKFEDISYSGINNLYIDKGESGEVLFTDNTYVRGKISVSDKMLQENMGQITICKDTKFMQDSVLFDVNIMDNIYISSPLHIYGNVSTSGQLRIYDNVIIEGNLIMKKSQEKNDIEVNYDDSLQINGNLILEDNIMTGGKGVIRLKGNMSGAGVTCDGEFSFNGNDRQDIDVNTCIFNTVNIDNSSDEGVHSKNVWNYKSINKNGNKLFFGINNGIDGWKLTSDETFNSTVTLCGNTLDLNGHTMTVNGDFIQEDGVIDFNNGKLIINGNYYMKKENEGGYISDSKGSLVMDNEEDALIVDGDFSMIQDYWVKNILTNGVIQISGNMSVSGQFLPTTDNRIILDGSKKQEIDVRGTFSSPSFQYLELKNTSEEGVIFKNTAYIAEKIITNGCSTGGSIGILENNYDMLYTHNGDIELKYDGVITGNIGSGNIITLNGAYKLEGKINVNGSIVLTGSPSVEGDIEVSDNLYIYRADDTVTGSIKAGKDIHLGNGNYSYTELGIKAEIEAGGNTYIDSPVLIYNNMFAGGSIYLKNYIKLAEDANIAADGSILKNNSGYILFSGENGYIYAAGNCDINAIYGTGVVEIAGNLKLYTATSEEYKLIMSGTGLQTISIPKNTVINTLELLNESEEGVFSEDILNINNLITNGNKIKYGQYIGKIGWKLEKDTVIDNNFVLLTGNLDLNGYKLIIQGDYIQQGGRTYINGGSLEICGDYRLQTITDDGYGPSNASLIMNNVNDRVIIKGTFYNQSSRLNGEALTDGLVNIYGNIDMTDVWFRASGSHTIVLCGEKAHTMTAEYTPYFKNITFDCEEVDITCGLTATGEVDSKSSRIYGKLTAVESTIFTGGSYRGDLIIDSEYEIKDSIIIYGNLEADGLKIAGGELNIEGDLCVDKINSESIGTIAVKGDLIIEKINVSENLRILLNGNTLQNICVSSDSTLGILELKNYSKDGVYSENSFNYKKLIRNGCQFILNGMEGEFGCVLESDSVYNGNLTLIGGEIDLNGHTYTINGNLEHTAGTINISNGKLIINGNYICANGSECSRGRLIIDGTEGIMDVNGSIFFNPYSASDIVLNAGKIYLAGNITHKGSTRINTGRQFELIFDGDTEQYVQFDIIPQIGMLTVENTSEAGVCFESDIFVSGRLSDIYTKAAGKKSVTIDSINILQGGTFGGNLIINNGCRYDRNVTVLGTLTLYGTNYLNGYTLCAGNLVLNSSASLPQIMYVEDGMIYSEGAMTVQNKAVLAMQNEYGYVKVLGSFNMSSVISHKGYLTSGTLEIAGNFNQTGAVNFIAEQEHITKLDGKLLASGKKLIQQVNFSYPGDATFGTLILTRQLNDGYRFNCRAAKVYKEIIYDIPSTSGIERVTGVEADNVTTTSVDISYKYSKDSNVSGYEIYRDGILLGITSNTVYTDNQLLPSHTYEYAVRAFDINKNVSELSETIRVTTKDDNSAPEKINDLGVMARTGSSVTLSWGIPQDDSGIAYYKIYRNGTIIADNVKNTQYCDKGLEKNKEYYYVVKSVDIEGNESEAGNRILTVVRPPEILKITTDKEDLISGNSSIKVEFANYGNYDGVRVKLEYLAKTGRWNTITELTASYVHKENNNLYVDCKWDTSMLKEQRDCLLRASVTDNGGCTTTLEKQFFIDNIPPSKVNGAEVQSYGGMAEISWEMCETADCRGYRIYRIAANGREALIADIDDIEKTVYSDAEVKSGMVYTYLITSYDAAGNESDVSEELKVKIEKDEEAPAITDITPYGGIIGSKAQIQVTAHDNKGIDRMSIYYSKDKDIWELIECKENKSSSIIFVWNTEDIPDGRYWLMAKAWDADGNVSEEDDTAVAEYTIDHTGPQAIEADVLSVSASSVKISWSIPEDENLEYFVVEQLEGDKYKRIYKTGSANVYTINGLNAATEYTFRVAAYDTLGNRGIQDGIVNVTTLSDTHKPEIKLMDIRQSSVAGADGGGEYYIDVTVNVSDDSGIGYMDVYVSGDGSDFIKAGKTVSDGKCDETLTYTMNVSDYNGGMVYIKCEVYDIYGNINELPETMPDGIIGTFFVDNEPPAKVMGVSVAGNFGSVELIWNECNADDLSGYNIYRADNGSGMYKLIATGIKECAYTDCSAVYNIKYEYRISAVDMNGNTGEKSEAVHTMVTEDKVCPVIRGISPATEKIGINQTMEILVTDNASLSKVQVSYKEKNSEYDNYYVIYTSDKKDAEVYDRFMWNTEGLQSGVYLIKVEAEDAAGNHAATLYKEYILDNDAPGAPEADVISGNFKVYINITNEKEEDFSHYDVQRKKVGETGYKTIASIVENEYTDADVEPDTLYYYKITAYDNAGNTGESRIYEVIPANVDDIVPHAYAPAYVIGISGQEFMLDGSLSSDNVGIVSYIWNLGNGNIFEGSRCFYVYDEPGTYKASLTVADKAGNTDSTDVIVEIRNAGDNGLAYINVTDRRGNPVEDASVCVLCGISEYANLATDSSGQAQLVGEPGKYTVMAYARGYTPSSVEANLSLLKNQKISVELSEDSIVTGDIEVHRMSIQEMIAAGVDLSDPGNFNTYTFRLTLAFRERPLPEYIIINANNNGVVGGSGGNGMLYGGGYYWSYGGAYWGVAPLRLQEPQRAEATEPMLCYMSITESVSWLMDMYRISVGVTNHAKSDFTLEDCIATLDIPEELSLAKMNTPQSRIQSLDDIRGGFTESAEWVIKGNRNGEYNINVSFDSVLKPFNVPVNAEFSAKKEFKASDANGLIIYVNIEDAAYIGKNYFVQYEIYNGTGRNLYNFRTSMGAYSTEQPYNEKIVIDPDTGEKTVYSSLDDAPEIYVQGGCSVPSISHITVGGEKYSVGVFGAEERLFGTYYSEVKNLTGAKNPDEIYYELIGYWVEELEGENLGVRVVVTSKPSHISRYMYSPMPVRNLYADPIDASTGAFLESKTAMSVSGNSLITFDLSYNSMLTGKEGELGKGWYHNFESCIDDYNGQLILRLSPEQALTFISDDMRNGVIYGRILSEGKIAIDSDKKYTGKFSCTSYGMEDYYIIKDEGGYRLFTSDKTSYEFNEAGKLTGITDKDRNTTSIIRKDNLMIIRDDISGTYLSVHYNMDGRVDMVENPLGDKITFIYDDEHMLCYTDALGNRNEYSYDGSGKIITVSENGRIKATNEYDEKGRVTAQTSQAGTSILSYEDTDTDHKVTITDSDGNIYSNIMDGRYNCIESIDGNGNSYRYVYDPNGNMTRKTNPLGNTTLYLYDDNGNLKQITDPDGAVTYMTADDNGNITKISDLTRTEYFTYDNMNHLIKSESENGTVKKYEYDDKGKLIRTTETGRGTTLYGYTDGRMTSVTTPNKNTSHMEYDSAGRMIKSIDSLGNVTEYEYNAKGYMTKVTNPDGESTYYEYDPSGNITKTVNALGGVTCQAYDDAGNLTHVTDVLGNTTEYTYDGAGNLIKTLGADGSSVTNEYDGAGNRISTTNILGQKSIFEYDPAGRLTRSTDHMGLTTDFEYDAFGRITKQTNADGTYVSYIYDKRGNRTKEIYSNNTSKTYTYDAHGNMLSVTDELNITVKYTYNRSNQITAVTDGNGNITRFEYDAEGNCISKTGADNTTIRMEYDPEGRITSISTQTREYGDVKISYEYDRLGRIIKTTDEMGNVSLCEYDALGRLTALRADDGSITAAYTYDVAGNMLTETDADGSRNIYTYNKKTRELIGLIQRANTDNRASYSYEYDKAGRITKATDPTGSVTSQTYNGFGSIKTLTDANGGCSSYSYDALGRLTGITNAIQSTTEYSYNAEGLLCESINARKQKTQYTYDKKGRITEKTDEAGKVSYLYDNNGNVLSVTEEAADGTIHTIRRTYDCMNRVKSLTDYNGNTIEYGYDELGNLLTLTYPGGEIVRYEYYPAGWLKSVTDIHGNRTTYEYDSRGRIIRTIMGDQTTEECEYDSLSHVTVRTTCNAEGKVLSRYEYSYDAAGNVITAEGFEGGSPDRLTSVQMTYDAANRLITYNGEAVRYDADGNMVYGPLDGVMTEFSYDCRNRLTGAGDTAYEYDAENTRICTRTPDYTEYYVTDTNTEYSRVLTAERSFHSGSRKLTTYTYGAGLISRYEEETGTEYYHYDNLGSTTYLTVEGEKGKTFAYGTYGELLSGNAGEERFLYNGRFGVMTDDNGLYYMRARYYNADIRRFINQDIITGNIAESQSLNRYAYCQGNPVNYMDPFGLSPLNILTAMGHAVLNILGAMPGGEVFDLINAAWYAAEGNTAEACICLVGAIPLFGTFAQAHNLTRLSKVLKFSSNVGKMWIGGSGAVNNLDNIYNMMSSGSGQWYDYLKEGGMLVLNILTCASGTGGAIDGLNEAAEAVQKADLKRYAYKTANQAVVRDICGPPVEKEKHLLEMNLQFFAGDVISRKPNQVHHFATNKSKTYTPQLEEITNKYGLNLSDEWNKELLPHQGRHPNEYHEYVLDSMKQFDEIAQGDKDIFLKLFNSLRENVRNNPDMLYKDYWK